MLLPAIPRPERLELQFALDAQSAFGFLTTGYGFRCVSANITFVRFETQDIFVNIYHGRSSYEIGVEIGRLAGTAQEVESGFTIEELLKLFGQEGAWRYNAGTTREVVQMALAERAEKLKLYGPPLLQGDPAIITALTDQRNRLKKEFAKEVGLRQIREKVEVFWREKNYREVISLYESIRNDLTTIETKRLEYAKKQLARRLYSHQTHSDEST